MDRVIARTFHERSCRRYRELMREAALFASDIGRERLINISHSGSAMAGYVVTVWYWER